MKITHTLLLANLLAICSSAALAQSPAMPTSANCAQTQTSPQQGTIMPRDTTTGRASEPLGDKLAKSDGVLCPPSGVDPDMHVPAPNAGNTPVIPPPGSPGGDPTVIPK